jgi:NitT/TauT family transport system substrate-binding protein
MKGSEDMGIKSLIVSTVAAIWISTALVGAAHAEPLRIFYFIWVGYGPLFVAQEKGFFAKEGVQVELINNEVHAAAFGGLFSGQVDAVAGALPDAPQAFQPDEEPLVCVLALDDSRGSDGVLASKSIRSVTDLKGQSVAFLKDSLQQFYLNVLLKEVGLSEADIEAVDLSAEDAMQVFLLQEVDAVVTQDPFLTQGREAEHGHLLADSSERPGLIADCLITRRDVFNERKPEFQALAQAWSAAVDYVEAHPAEASEIMARHLGGGLEDPAVFAESLGGIRLYDAEMNREYFGTPEQPGPIYRTMQHAIDVWTELGVVKAQITPADVIAHGIYDE